MLSSEMNQFCHKFGAIAAEVLGQLSGKTFSCETMEATASQSFPHAVVLRAKSGSGREVMLRYGSDLFKFLAEALLGESVGEESSPELTETALEAWRQVVGRANTALREELAGDELEVLPVSGDATYSLTAKIRLAGESSYEVIAEVSPDFFHTVATAADARVQPAQGGGDGQGRCGHQNLDLLLEIPLSVTLKFGERRMPLRNILELSSGAVLELDCHADEPVDLCLDERVIARGQVVVVDGCYGLRVTQICRPIDYGMSTGAQA